MQVSWIEPDELRDLASQLLDPEPKDESMASVELHTLPDPSAIPGPLLHEQTPDGHFEARQTLPSPELEQIREKLRAIRDRAQDAGLLPVAKEPERQSAFTVDESNAGSEEHFPEEPEAQVQPEEPAEPEIEVVSEPTQLSELPTESSIEEIAPSPSPSTAAPSNAPKQVRFVPVDGTISERLNSFAVWAVERTQSEDLIIIDDHGAPLWGDPSHNDLAVSAMLALGTTQRSDASGFNSDLALHSKIGNEKELTIFRSLSRYGLVSVATVGTQHISDELVKELREALLLSIDEAQV